MKTLAWLLLPVLGCAASATLESDATELPNSAGDKSDRAITNVRLTDDPDGSFSTFTLLCEDAGGCDIALAIDVRDLNVALDGLGAAGKPPDGISLVDIRIKGPLATDLEWNETLRIRAVDGGGFEAATELVLAKQPKGSYMIEVDKTELPAVPALRLAISAQWAAAE